MSAVSAVDLPPEFLLVAACCRWPASPSRDAAVRDAAARVADWNGVLQAVRRQRVGGLTHDALVAAKIDIPPPVAAKLAAQPAHIAQENLRLAREASRLQRLFAATQIPVVTLKGLALAQLAYGSYASKQTRDLDLLVPLEYAEAAMQLLEGEGYVLLSPAKQLGEAQRRAVIRYGKDVELMHRDSKLLLDLQWRVAENPLLLKGIDADSPAQDVVLADGLSLRTLALPDLFAYLCVHGAYHAWSRLKWLADLNALIASHHADVTQLYRHAQSRGAGLCAGQALLLCQRLLDLRLPEPLGAEIQHDRRVEKLAAIALQTMTRSQLKKDIGDVTDNVRMKFLLGQGWPFFAAQCRIALVGVRDVIAVPLPRPLHFLYPLLRLPLWLWRRATAA
jgi:hypothetical protein